MSSLDYNQDLIYPLSPVSIAQTTKFINVSSFITLLVTCLFSTTEFTSIDSTFLPVLYGSISLAFLTSVVDLLQVTRTSLD